VVYFSAQRLVNGAFNLVATYILVRCTLPKPNASFYSCWLLTHKGQRPVILVEQQQTVLVKGAAHRHLLSNLTSVPKPYAGFIHRAFILIPTLCKTKA